MWRVALLIGFSCSVVLNVYLFMELSIRTIENKFQQKSGVHLQQPATQIKKDQIEDNKKDNYSDIEGTQSVEQLANSIKNSINGKDYFNASYLITTLANDHKAELSDVRLFWLDATQALIQQKLFTHAENSISAYLSFQSDDSDFLYQQVDLYWQQKLPLLAIRYAYEVQYHVFNEVENRAVVNYARQLVQQQVDVLITNNLWLELRSLIEEVLLFDSQNPNLQWLLVRAQYQLGQFEYARNAIEPLLNQPNYKIKAQALLAEIETALREPQSIPLSRQGKHFIVQALINDTFNVSLMLDTGASISLLSEPAFEGLSRYSEVVYVKDLQLNTAGGIITASIYQVDQFTIQDYIINDFIFAVSPYVSEGNDGLLGMNYLSAFDFYIDQNNSLLILKNK
jgi:clan AA aspartic protease (TIGR02281 family)